MRRLLTPGWLLAHLATTVMVIAFLALGWWQVGRAAAGNPLSYGYAVEWPVFAGFVIFVWFGEVRKALRATTPHAPVPESELAVPGSAGSGSAGSGSAGSERRATGRVVGSGHDGPAYDDSDDERLADYNRYLAWLNANPHASPSQYPG